MRKGWQSTRGLAGQIAIFSVLSTGMLQGAVAAAATGSPESVKVEFSSSTGVNSVKLADTVKLPDAKLTTEEAIAKIKEWFPQLKPATVSGTSFRDSSNKMLLSIQWEIREQNGSSGFDSSIDLRTGDIVQVYIPTDRYGKDEAYFPPKLTEEKARERAESLIRKLMPSLADVAFVKSNHPYPAPQNALFSPIRYYFQFQPVVNGIPSPSDSANIELDGNGNVRSVNRYFAQGEYPDAQPKITQEQAVKKFADAADVVLQYIPVRKNDKIDAWFLGYMPKFPMFGRIDAATGEFASNAFETGEYADIPVKPDAVKARAERTQMTVEEAADFVRKALNLEDTYQLQNQSLIDRWNGQDGKVWSLTLGKDGNNPSGWISANVNTVTGQILQANLSRYGPFSSGEESSLPYELTWESAKDKAIAFIQKLYPNASKELKLIKQKDMEKKQISEYNRVFSFSFQRFVNDLPVNGDTASITLDLQGKLMNYYTSGGGLDEQTARNLKAEIGKDEAIRTLLEQSKVELQYGRLESDAAYNMGTSRSASIKLLYVQTYKNTGLPTIVDAADGKLRSVWDFVQPNEPGSIVQPTDIDGHAARQELETAVNYRVLEPDAQGKVNPDKSVALGEWIQMAARAADQNYERNYYGDSQELYFADVKEDSLYKDAVRFFVLRGWLEPSPEDKLGAEQTLTREALATSLMKIAKYDKLAVLLSGNGSGGYAFKDADQIKNKGAAALVVQLGLVDAADGAFHPERSVTKAEAAQALVRLAHLLGKLDQAL